MTVSHPEQPLQMTTDYQDENHWLKHKETGLMLKMEKQTGDHFELRKPK